MILTWKGPFSWPNFEEENFLPELPKHSGLYLQCFEYQKGYLIYAAGLTRRLVSTRFKEHTRKYLSGDYTILDLEAAQHGVRKEIWHGWGWTQEKRAEFEEKKQDIIRFATKQLAGFRIFVAEVPTEPRILERLEASIMNTLYTQPEPFCNIPDRGMMLAPKWETEEAVTTTNQCENLIYGLPKSLII